MIWIDYLVLFINAIFTLLFWLVIIAVLLSYFMDPYHPVRRWVDSVVEPLLAPIRRILPPIAQEPRFAVLSAVRTAERCYLFVRQWPPSNPTTLHAASTPIGLIV